MMLGLPGEAIVHEMIERLGDMAGKARLDRQFVMIRPNKKREWG
jgi:hypothetical protein